MRIGMMADVYKPHVSGITTYLSLNKKYLEARGHEVFIFTFSEEEYRDDEENVIRSPGLPLLDTGYYISLRYSPEARKLLRTMDIAHVHHPFLSGSLALLYCQRRNIPVVFTNHTRYDLYSQVYLPPMIDVLGITALKSYLPSFCKSCNLVVAPSPGLRDILINFGVTAFIDVVPNGVDLRPFRPPVEPANRSDYGLTASDVVLAYLGRLGPEKNLPFLLRSFSGAVQAYPQARLIIIGDGPERQSLEELASHIGLGDSVRFIGSVPYDHIPDYLAMSDAFVTASVTEVHPLTVIEAMAAGLPVLGISSPGVGDLVQDGENGFLAAQEDLAVFTAKMVRLVGENESRKNLGARALELVQDYAIEKTTAMMEERYQRVIEQARDKDRSLRGRFSHWLNGVRA